ncbi:MAG: ATP-binding protein, partial [Candidatus Omnitrophota bacterium]
TGLSREELIGTDFSDYFTESEKARAGYQQVFDKGFVTGYPLTIRHKAGRLMDVLYNAAIYKDTRGNAIGIFAAARDVTVQKQAEEELRRHKDSLELIVKERTAQLRESEQDLKRAQAVAHIGSWRLDVRRNELSWSDEVYRIFGIPEGTPMTYETFVSRIHPDDRELVDKTWKAALAGERYEIEHRILAGNGIKWVKEQAELEFDKEGALLGGFGTVQDITERKKTEDLLREAHNELEAKVLFRTRELVAINKQLNGEIIRRKETEKELSARTILLEVLNKSASRKDYIDNATELIKKWSQCRSAGIRILNNDGMIPYESHIDFSDEFLGLENNLSVKEDRCICVRIIKGKTEAVDKPFMSEFGTFYCNDTMKFAKELSGSEETKFRGTCIKKGFRSLAVIPIRNRDKIIGAIHLADEESDKIDVKSREFIEALSGLIGEAINKFNLEDKVNIEHDMLSVAHRELEHARRLSDIGTLAATVAHELRNPLAAIHMASYNIRRKAQNPLLDKHLATIEKKVNESDQIINNLLFYSRLKSPQYESFNICDIMDECITVMKDRYQKNEICIEARMGPLKKISIEADPLQLKEVFNNILGNACDAITDGRGKVEIEGGLDGSFVRIRVKDNGSGISAEDMEKVFDPFFTTKAKGTGLGLTVCKQIMEFHDGIIDIVSRQGEGTAITIKLPVKKVDRCPKKS